MPKERSLLVTKDGANRNLDAIKGVVAKCGIGCEDIREGGFRDTEDVTENRVPALRFGVEEKGTAGITGVCDVVFAICQAINEPAVDSADGEVTTLGSSGDRWDVCEHPGPLCGRKVRVDEEAGPLPNVIGEPACADFFAERSCSATLPDDGIAERFTGGAAPCDGGFALVGDADCGNILRANIVYDGIQHIALNSKYFARIMFDPATLRKVLREGLLVGCDGCEIFVEGDGTAARCPGIDGDEDGGWLVVHGWSVPIQDSVV